MAVSEYYGTGRRKSSTARVFLRPGSGAITINRRPFTEAFPTEALRTQIRQPLVVTENGERFDVLVNVAGGGVAGQAGAVRLGIARALVQFDAELRKPLKKDGLLTRDARTKEMQTLDYIQSALLSCREQAAGDRHVMLAYLIEMAYVEASDLLRRLNEAKKTG